jgi:predicted phage terminase large subunit-like protein
MEQQFVSTWIHEEFKKKNEAFGFPFPLRIDAVRTKSSKYFRIESMVPWFAHGHFKFNKQRQHSQDFENLVNQIKAFEQKSQTPDDGPDALQGAADKALRLPPQGATISGICTGSSRKVKGA